MKVAIVAIARLENDYINEWVGHHLKLGVDHIYVYDNSSSEEEKLCVYDEYENKVTIVPAYDKPQYQMPAYKNAYYTYGHFYDYIIYIDIDEFIVLQKDNTIKEFVSRFPDDLECYRMNWVLYGDNNIVNRDTSSSVMKDFTVPSINIRKNTTTKSIIKSKINNIDFISVHYAIKNTNGKKSNLKTYFGNMVDITKELPIDAKSLNIHKKDYTYVKLNHYITKSICEFVCQKMRRPDAAWNYERNIDKDFFVYNSKTPEKEKAYKDSTHILKYYYWHPGKGESERYNIKNNAGDYFNKILVNKLYHCVCKPVTKLEESDVVFCGSLLNHPPLKLSKYIVGCGFHNDKEPVNKNPLSYLAVRGKLTKARLIQNRINVGDVKFVDPGLLVSKIYDLKNVKKKYDIGIIPHYVDEEQVVNRYGNQYKIISMKTTDVQNLCRQIKECGIILSSSLHGIIFSHSFGVPAYHIEMNKLQQGDNFKFKDYYTCYNNVKYNNFKCKDFNIPFEHIIEFDKNHRESSNPSMEEIIKKQNDFLSVLPYKEYLNKKYKVSHNISVCFTSHKGRINNIRSFIYSILNQTIKCNVHLTLSSDEFPRMIDDLPESIKNIHNDRFHIHWVKSNIKPFKKSLYTLKYISDDSIIVTLDDDVLLKNDTIEQAINYFDGNNPLSIKKSVRSVGYNGKMYTPTGCFCVYNKDMVKNWEKVINNEIVSTNDDDSFMLSMFWLNGYYNKYIPIHISFNSTIGNKNDVLTERFKQKDFKLFAMKSDSIISKSVEKITGKPLYESFGYFNGGKSHSDSLATKQPVTMKQSSIANLRKDIQSGAVIRIPVNGGFIWRRVK